MTREKTIERIRKLMELAANNPSVSEATAAALKAQRMMAEHGIEEYEVMRTAEEVVTEIRSNGFKGSPWAIHLGIAIADNFRCRMYVYADQCFNWETCKNEVLKSVVFIGRSTDAAAATITFEKLFQIGNKLSGREERAARKKYGTASGVRNAFLIGYVDGIRIELEKQCVALALVTPADVNEYADDKLSDMPTRTAEVRNVCDFDAYGHGVVAGRDAMKAGRIEA